MNDSFLTIDDGGFVEIKERGSKFLSIALHCKSEPDAEERLAQIRKTHHDATHHCSAWRVGSDTAAVERFDDDGEPNQTAGRPILQAIQAEDLHQTLVIVVRYYGGTKLGCGGLARAYGQAAALALKDAASRTIWHEATIDLICAWDDIGLIEATLGQLGEQIRGCRRNFAEEAAFRVTVLQSFLPCLKQTMEESTRGRVDIK